MAQHSERLVVKTDSATVYTLLTKSVAVSPAQGTADVVR